MAPRKPRKRKADEDIIKTEPDNRRATGNESEDEDLELGTKPKKPAKPTWKPMFTNIAATRASFGRKAISGKVIATSSSLFPFLQLPAEVRNMIYRYLVISQNGSGHIAISSYEHFTSGGIETSILFLNKQVYNEASAILYRENKIVFTHGIPFRRDHPAVSKTHKSLRSGRRIDMTEYKGIIYDHVAQRLRNVDYEISLFLRHSMCYGHTARCSFALKNRLLRENLLEFLQRVETQYRKDVAEGINRPEGTGWTIKIKTHTCERSFTYHCLSYVLEPLWTPVVFDMVRNGLLRVKVEGHFGLGWQKAFRSIAGYPGYDKTEAHTNKDLIWKTKDEEIAMMIKEYY